MLFLTYGNSYYALSQNYLFLKSMSKSRTKDKVFNNKKVPWIEI